MTTEQDKKFPEKEKCDVCDHPMDEGDPTYCNYCADWTGKK
jgi:hypothetical protein